MAYVHDRLESINDIGPDISWYVPRLVAGFALGDVVEELGEIGNFEELIHGNELKSGYSIALEVRWERSIGK